MNDSVSAGADFWARPQTGNYLTILAAAALQFNIILLPLVGPAGVNAPHATKNFIAFLAALSFTTLISALALYSKLRRKALDQSPMPKVSVAQCAVCLFLFYALFQGLFHI
jgi:hypothetical protein